MFDKEKWKKIQNQIGFKNTYDDKLALPNELFEKLTKLVKEGKLKSTHIGFAYSYIYLRTYLYRFVKYNHFVPSTKEIKSILGYNETNKGVDYIIKRNGLLEQEGILLTTSDFPTVIEYEEQFLIISTINKIGYAKEFRKEHGLTTNQYCKYPVFGYHRTWEDYENDEPFDGTFYKADRTHIIDFQVFAHCMANSAIGTNGFYLYCYIKHKNDIFQSDYNATAERLSEETKFSVSSIKRYLDSLRSYQLVTTTHEQDYFVIGLFDTRERRASGHYANDYAFFSWEKVLYPKMKHITLEKYQAMKQQFDDGLENIFAES